MFPNPKTANLNFAKNYGSFFDCDLNHFKNGFVLSVGSPSPCVATKKMQILF